MCKRAEPRESSSEVDFTAIWRHSSTCISLAADEDLNHRSWLLVITSFSVLVVSDECSKCLAFYFQIGGVLTRGCPQDFDKNQRIYLNLLNFVRQNYKTAQDTDNEINETFFSNKNSSLYSVQWLIRKRHNVMSIYHSVSVYV